LLYAEIETILEKRLYNVEFKSATWETCTLRKYLNGEFYNELGAVKSSIADTPNNNPSNPSFSTTGGNATNDKVFLLSIDEVRRYFGDSTAALRKIRKGEYSYSNKNNLNRIADYGSEGASWWWLRSPGLSSDDAACVSTDGSLYVDGDSVRYVTGGARPALWLNL